ncbi:hypothetical protein EC9_21620 [Rosistilla ulvae]|uniref:Uncharacterized protein n=1 Tax=Rosistilla ulvae TaxID=1930277 RepID=A0A517LZD0_9BACT|nr:hypothetical protein EC9_21620 [Rosistilla ulvae]
MVILRPVINRSQMAIPLSNETLLNVFPTDDERHRLVVAIQRCDGDADRLVLRQETFSQDVGWFTQSCIAIEPEQLPGLKMALTSNTARKLQRPCRSGGASPAVLSFSEAAASRVG